MDRRPIYPELEYFLEIATDQYDYRIAQFKYIWGYYGEQYDYYLKVNLP